MPPEAAAHITIGKNCATAPRWTAAHTDRLIMADEIETLISLFESIAAEEGWQPGSGLRIDQDRSIYIALRDNLTSPGLIGGLQIVLPDEQGRLPSQRV